VHMYTSITAVEDAAAALQRLGGARAVLATAPSADAMGRLCPASAPRGKLYRRGCSARADAIECLPACFWRTPIYGSLAGTAIETEDGPCLQRSGEHTPDDRDSSARASCRGLRSHDERQSTVPHGARCDEGWGCSRRTGSLKCSKQHRALSLPERRLYDLSFPAFPSFLKKPQQRPASPRLRGR